ncbi:MAG: hypothetical protein J5527_10485 [Treponema sp.]|nr:hypothetical protein [Treponema sp.]
MKKCIFFTIFAGVLSLFTACKDVEIGLGSAVDTEAAKLTVHETPRAGDVVRGSFMLSGICTDDTEIKSFTITFENTAEKDQKIEFSTTPDKTTGEWALIIDPRQELTTSGSTLAGTNKTGITPETQMVPDGEYQVTFKVIDQVKHETIVTRQFKIDNTPPVIVIERPSSKKDAAENSIDSYGQSFTLEGQSADDNDVKTIEVRVYDEVPGAEEAVETSEAETPAASIVTPKIITLNNVPSRINMDIAKYVHGEENDYSQIYGSTEKAGSKKFYCELIAYDSAVRYPIDGSEQSEEDLKGNKTDFYYLLTDISTDILSKYKITDVYHMLSGTYKATGTDSTERSEAAGYGEEYVKKYLSRTEKKTAMGSFTLNPENSPSFTVMGRAQLKTEGKLFSDDDEYSDYKVTNENTLMIEVATGLDSIPLLTEEKWAENPEYSERYQDYKFRPYFTECDENGIELNAQNRIYPTQVTKKVSGLNHQFTVVIKKEDGFQYRHNYRIGVEGFDESGNSILNTGSGYGFRFVSNGMPPVVEVKEPKEDTTRLKIGEGIRFCGTISTEDGTPDLILYKSDGKTEIYRKDFTEEEARINEETLELEYDYDYTIPASVFNQEESQEYKIILQAENIRTTKDEKIILYDVEGPDINITDIKPVVNNGVRANNINKTITVKGNLDDVFDSVASAEWKLTQTAADGTEKIIQSGSDLRTTFNFEVDTTKAEDKKEALFKINAKDKAGNESVVSESFFVDQSTDIPTIAPSDTDSLTFNFKDKNQLIQGNKGVIQDEIKNIYTANSQVLMDFTDDDGIETIEVTTTVDPDNYSEEEQELPVITVLARNATEYTYAYKTPVQDGYYTIAVKVTDNTGVSAEQSFCILVSSEVPAIETWLDDVLLEESMTQTKTSAYVFKYKLAENYGMAEGYPLVTINKDNVPLVENTGFTQTDFTDEETETNYKIINITNHTDGLYEYNIVAKDLVGKETKVRRNVLLDTTAPVITVTSPVLTDWQNVTTVKINGSAEDKSGTYAVWYSFGAAAMPVIPSENVETPASWTSKGWTKATGTTSWSFILADITDGSQQKLFIAAVDSNGAVTTGSQVISATVKVDATNPTLTETGIGAGTQYKNAAFALCGVAEDNGSGLAELSITNGTTTWTVTPNNGLENPADKGKWTLEVPVTSLSEGTNAYTISATDNAGRSTIENRTVFYDKTKPGVSTKTVTTQGVTVGGENGRTWYNTNQIGISIVPVDPRGENNTDGSGITQLECSTDRISWTVLGVGTGENANAYVGNIACPLQGENKIYIRIIDRAGNTNEPANEADWTEGNTLTVYVDTQNATFTDVKEVKADGTTAALTGVKLVTGRDSLTFSVNAVDVGETAVQSGLASVRLTGIDGTAKNIAATYNETTGKYQMTIATTDMPEEITPVNVKVTVEDAAGNSEEITAFQLQKDNVYPLATVGVIADADNEVDGTQVNGIITVSGTASDTHTLTNVKLQYSTSTASVTEGVTTWSNWSNWTDYEVNYTGTPYSWSYEINTTSLFTDESKVRFRAIASDESGNSGNSGNNEAQYDETSFKEVYISQKTDRPVIRLSNLSMSGMTSSSPVWINSKDLFGTISDDDGEIQSVKILVKDSVPTDTEWSAAAEIYNRGSWSYKFDTDGVKQIYFRVVDARNKTFISNSTTNTTFGPKIMDSVSPTPNNTDNSVFQNSDILYVKVDTVQPVLTSLSYYASATEIAKEQFGSIPDSAWTVQPVSTTAITEKFGGTKRYLYFKYSVYDINGVNSVKAELDGTEANQTHHKEMNSDATSKQFISYFDIRGITTGNARLTIKMKDHAAAASTSGTETPSNFELPNLDNASPSISFSNYQSGAQVYGSSSVTLRGTTSDSHRVSKVQYALTSSFEIPLEDNAWTEITNTEAATYTNALGWQIVFDGNTTTSDTSSFHAPLLKASLVELYGVDDDEIKPVYVWIRAVDELGNDCTNVDEFMFYVIPNGDRPSISISYPTNNSSVGGSIRITGSTEIQDTSASISNVYIQIDPSYNEAEGFNAGWATELQELMTAKGVTSYSIVNAAGIETGKGISSQGTSKLSWYLNVNANKELNSKVNNGNRVLGIRAFAISSTGKVSGTQVYKCEVDPEAPVFGQTRELRFVQYSDNNLTVESASRRYENNISLKGQWYLVGSVEDESGIRQITLNGTNVVWTTGEGTTTTVHSDGSGRVSENNIESSVSPFKNYDLKIPVGSTETDKFGEIKYEIETTDGSDSQASNLLEFTVSYDNKKPDFVVQTGNGVGITANGIIRQSNGAYTVAGTYAEPSEGTKNQSGFSRIAMFFTRTRTANETTTLYLLDPMVNDGDDGDDNFYPIGTVSGNNVTLGTGIVEKEGLYWRTANATLADEKYLTVTGSLPYNVRAGGLCMVENVIYRIKSVSGTTLVLDGILTAFSTPKEVYFALAQVIDNLSQESGTTTVAAETDSTVNGDGDCMIEGVQISGGIYNWNATLDSSNMLDGKVNMNFVAYDKAGNYTPKTIVQKISNNAPRIAGVTFGADKDLNGSVSNDEMISTYSGVYTNIMHLTEHIAFNGQDANGNWITAYNPYEGSNDRLVIKGAIKVIPEIVGGNGGLGYSYTYKDSSSVTKTTGVKAYTAGHSSNGQVRTDNLTINITLEDFLKNNIAEGTQNLVFNIWDKTDDAALGNAENGSEKATITLPVNVMIADSVPPTAVITPLYWEKAAKNSIYLNNVENGHIELESELPNTFTVGGTGVNDRDAKVSGKITFEVKAEDNVIVNEIKVAIAEILPEPAQGEDPQEITVGYDGGEGLGNEFTIASRNASGTWVSENYNTSLTGNSATDWSFELVNDAYNEETGKNTVKFKFHFDTSKVTGGAAKDIGVSFIAYDKGSPERIENNDVVTIEYGNENDSEPGFYRIDIVPYITKVYTSLAKLKSNNWSVYNRTALGHYPVAGGEEIIISGFNLTDGTVSFESSDENTATVAYDVDGMQIPANAKSGKVSIKVSGVESLNNKNNNDSKGSYTGSVELSTNPTGDYDIYKNYYYNRQPNGDNNNLLTDDVVVDVWEINSQAVKPKIGGITQPVMNINPTNGQIGFAFVNGTLYYSMPYGIQKNVNDTNSTQDKVYSYYYWIGGIDQWTSVSFAYDEYGHSFGTTAGGDINERKADQFRIMTSRWGNARLHNEGYRDGQNQLRLEMIGQQEYTGSDTSYTVYPSFNKERIQSPALATTASDVDNTTVYLAYYDDCNDEIRFKWGGFTDTTKTATGGFFADIYGDAYNNQAAGISGGKYIDATGNAMYGVYRLDYNSLIAGQTKDHVTSTTGTKVSAEVKTTDNQSVYAGKYVSIAALKGKGNDYIPEGSSLSIKDDAIVAVWWDGTNNQLVYSYNMNPHGIEPGEYLQADTGWTKTVPIFATGIGEYCKIKADSQNGIHIVGYDSNNCDVWYAYVANFTNPAGKKTCLVDSYGIIGTELNIDVALKNGKPVPYISYYANSCVKPKTAYLVGSIDSLKEGAVDEIFTGEWEISIIPTLSKVPEDHINIGLWKTDGEISNSIKKENTYNTNADVAANQKSYGSIWGNGTANPVLGYAITTGNSGYIETAQMK